MRIALALALLGGIAGCQETHHCDPGVYGSGCQFSLSGQVDSGFRDAGMDGGDEDAPPLPDTGVDAFVPDAGLCNGACEASGQVCYEGEGGADGGHAAGCVECVDHPDCRHGDAGMADAGLGVPYCIDFECTLGCLSDAECGPNACRADGTCSAYPVESDVCMPCDTDANCMVPLRCVEFANGGHTGSYCLADVLTFGACTSRRRFTATLPSAVSVDGASSRDYCVPPSATCEAVLDASTTVAVPCTAPAMCGGGTGRCSPAMACTYVCANDDECPAGQDCPSATNLCRRL